MNDKNKQHENGVFSSLGKICAALELLPFSILGLGFLVVGVCLSIATISEEGQILGETFPGKGACAAGFLVAGAILQGSRTRRKQ